MGFRDETQALRARIESLEGELASARDELEALEADRRELLSLRARVTHLEAELAKYAPKPRAKSTPRQAKRPRLIMAAGALALGVATAVFVLAPGKPDHNAIPRHGVLALDIVPRPAPVQAAVTGTLPVSELASRCRGYVESQPSVALRLDEPRRVRAWTEGNTDLVLFVRDGNGQVYCDDDSGEGMNPELMMDLPAGEHALWVGTYTEDARSNYALYVDAQLGQDRGVLADAAATLETVRISGVDRHVLNGQTRGETSTTVMGEGCRGFVPAEPQVDLDVREPGTAQIVARASEDLVLLVRRPDGSIVCDDDGAGNRDPRIVEDLQTGHYRIWVGTFTVGRSADFELAIDVDGARAPDPDETPRLGHWDLGMEAVLSFTENVGGRTPISTTHPECRTLFGTEQPDLELTLGQDRTVTLTLTTEARLGLLIEHPDGTQTCETALASRPVSWSAGTHRVWIGAPTPGASAPFTLMAQTQPR